MLGDLQNAVEFLPLHDDAFMADYNSMQACAEALTLDRVQAYVQDMALPAGDVQAAWDEFERFGREDATEQQGMAGTSAGCATAPSDARPPTVGNGAEHVPNFAGYW